MTYPSESFSFSFSTLDNKIRYVQLNVFTGMIDVKLIIPSSNELIGEDLCKDNCSIELKSENLAKYSLGGFAEIKVILTDKSDLGNMFNASSKYQLVISPDDELSLKLISQGIINKDEVKYGKIKYYYAYIPKNREVFCSVYFTDDEGLVYGKLLQSSKYSEEELLTLVPKEETATKFQEKYWNSVLSLSKEDTSSCEDYCLLLISIKGESKYQDSSNNDALRKINYELSITSDVAEISINHPIS